MDKVSPIYNNIVQQIKSAILESQLESARAVNQQMLSLYSIKKMRQFYEKWEEFLNRPPMAGELEKAEFDIKTPIIPIHALINLNRSPMAEVRKRSIRKRPFRCSRTSTSWILSMWKNWGSATRRILTNAWLKKPLSRMSRISEAILAEIKKNPGMNAPAIAAKLTLALRTTQRYLKTLTDDKKIEFRGAPKNGGYFVNLENSNN